MNNLIKLSNKDKIDIFNTVATLNHFLKANKFPLKTAT
jgi:hypothetical protein